MTDIVLDICGTLSDNRHRLHLCPKFDPAAEWPGPRSWDAFMAPELVAQDGVNQHVWNAVRGLLLTGGYDNLVISTGRSEILREVTREWLRRAAASFGLQERIDDAELHMRPLDDRRPSEAVKRAALADMQARGLEPAIAFEDRVADARMYRGAGLFVLQVAEGDF